jgi:hypothetical protein
VLLLSITLRTSFAVSNWFKFCKQGAITRQRRWFELDLCTLRMLLLNAGAEEMRMIGRGKVRIDEQAILLTTVQFINKVNTHLLVRDSVIRPLLLYSSLSLHRKPIISVLARFDCTTFKMSSNLLPAHLSTLCHLLQFQ